MFEIDFELPSGSSASDGADAGMTLAFTDPLGLLSRDPEDVHNWFCAAMEVADASLQLPVYEIASFLSSGAKVTFGQVSRSPTHQSSATPGSRRSSPYPDGVGSFVGVLEDEPPISVVGTVHQCSSPTRLTSASLALSVPTR
eukprot:scaffold923_cov256-Pinguiococcus_pyrenoidosus.AAC.18